MTSAISSSLAPSKTGVAVKNGPGTYLSESACSVSQQMCIRDSLISVQRESFERFKDEGLREAFKESSPIQSQNHVLEVTFGEHQFGDLSLIHI